MIPHGSPRLRRVGAAAAVPSASPLLEGSETAAKQRKVGAKKGTAVRKRAGAKKPAPKAAKASAAAGKGKRKRKKADSDEEEWQPEVKVEGRAASGRGRQRKTVSYAEDSDSDDSGSEPEAEEEEEELICKPTRSDGSELPPDWDGLDLSSSKLHAVVWERIVIDEAHKIKGRTTNVAKAIYALRAEHRWCLSGTPLQNNVRQLRILCHSLVIRLYVFGVHAGLLAGRRALRPGEVPEDGPLGVLLLRAEGLRLQVRVVAM